MNILRLDSLASVYSLTIGQAGAISWINLVGSAQMDATFAGGDAYWHAEVTLGPTSPSQGGFVIARIFNRHVFADPTSVAKVSEQQFFPALNIPLVAGDQIWLWVTSSPAYSAPFGVVLVTADVGIIFPKLGHVSRLRIQDPGASSGEGVTGLDRKRLSSKVLTLEGAREVVIEALNQLLLGAGVIAANPEFWAKFDIMSGIIEHQIGVPTIGADELLDLLNVWTFSDGYNKLLDNFSTFGKTLAASGGVEDLRDLQTTPYEYALRLLFEKALSQNSARAWVTNHHRKRLE